MPRTAAAPSPTRLQTSLIPAAGIFPSIAPRLQTKHFRSFSVESAALGTQIGRPGLGALYIAPHLGKAPDNEVILLFFCTGCLRPSFRAERTEMGPRDKVLSLIPVYLVDRELVGNQLSIFCREVVGFARLCV